MAGVAGSITHLLPKLWEEPVVWRADRPRGPWRQISLPLPAETASARALALSCSGGGEKKGASGGKGGPPAFPVETAPVKSRPVANYLVSSNTVWPSTSVESA